MGCGASSLKGEAIHDLSGMPRSSLKSKIAPSSQVQAQQQPGPVPNNGNLGKSSGIHHEPQPDDGNLADSLPPIKVTNPSGSTDQTSNNEAFKQRSSTSSASRFRAKMSGGSFSLSSQAPRKKARELTDEDLLKHTGMTAEQLKQWGDQNIYRRQDVAGAGAAMNTAYLTTGAIAY